jgi:protease I
MGMKKVVFIIASRNFRDEELLEPKKVLEDAGVRVVLASSSLDTAVGMLGARVKPDILLKDVRVDEYDGVVFVGGSGASEYWNDPTAHAIAKEALEKNKLLGAICIAPVTLARAGLLKGKKATVFDSEVDKLKEAGAVYTGSGVERDGKIVTGRGPTYAREFGETLLRVLQG